MNNLNAIKFFDHKDISLDDVIAISQGIAEENRKKPHMIQDEPEVILECVQKYGGMVAKNLEGQLTGFIKLSQLDQDTQVYERGSLFVMPAHRGKGIGRFLIESLTEQYKHLSLLSVTNVPSVIKVNSQHSEQVELIRNDIPHRLRNIIEGPQSLLPDDRVFINHTLRMSIISGQFK